MHCIRPDCGRWTRCLGGDFSFFVFCRDDVLFGKSRLRGELVVISHMRNSHQIAEKTRSASAVHMGSRNAFARRITHKKAYAKFASNRRKNAIRLKATSLDKVGRGHLDVKIFFTDHFDIDGTTVQMQAQHIFPHMLMRRERDIIRDKQIISVCGRAWIFVYAYQHATKHNRIDSAIV